MKQVQIKAGLVSLAAVTLTVGLAGCSTNSATVACGVSGQSSESVSVTGDFGIEPTVDYPTPLKVETTQVTTVIEGEGDLIDPSHIISLAVAGYSGSVKGETLGSTGFGDSSQSTLITPNAENTPVGLTAALSCVREGERVVAVIPADELQTEAEAEASATTSTENTVFVFDVIGHMPGRAEGKAKSQQNGFPTVTLTTTGRPGISVPSGDAPAETKVATLIEGRGATVSETDLVTIQYSMFNNTGGEQLSTSWENQPVTVPLDDEALSAFTTMLVGQTVGSQVVAVLSAEESATLTDILPVPSDSTAIFVVDILAATAQ